VWGCVNSIALQSLGFEANRVCAPHSPTGHRDYKTTLIYADYAPDPVGFRNSVPLTPCGVRLTLKPELKQCLGDTDASFVAAATAVFPGRHRTHVRLAPDVRAEGKCGSKR
jgi:hypothetical protein